MKYAQSTFQVGNDDGERSRDAEIYAVDGTAGVAEAITYTVVVHAKNGDLFYPNVIPWDRWPDSMEIQPTKIGTPVTAIYCGNLLKFQFEEKPLTFLCENP